MLNTKTLFASAIIGVVTTILTVTEGSMKSLLQDWQKTCVIVFNVSEAVREDTTTNFVVELFPNGNTPSSLPLTFASREGALKMVEFMRDTSAVNLGFHPFTLRTCPGKLCSVAPSNEGPPYSDLIINLTPFDPAIAYKFRVVLENLPDRPPWHASDLSVFVVYPERNSNDTSRLCAVQRAVWYNFMAWMAPYWKITVIAVLLVLISVSVGLLKRGE